MGEQEAVNPQILRMRREILGDKNNDSLDEAFNDKLEDAKLIFLNKVYPFDREKTDIPERYIGWQTRCAIELYHLEEDGEFTSYSENGLSWTKEKTGLSSKLLNELPPPQAGAPI